MSEREYRRQAAVIFRKAAAYIRTYGWQERGMSRDGQPRCSMGALESAHPIQRWDKHLAQLMYDMLYSELGGINLTQFNHEVQAGEPVALLFERAADRLVTY